MGTWWYRWTLLPSLVLPILMSLPHVLQAAAKRWVIRAGGALLSVPAAGESWAGLPCRGGHLTMTGGRRAPHWC